MRTDFCVYCMNLLPENCEECPHCRKKRCVSNQSERIGQALIGKKHRAGYILGSKGFGITCFGRDNHLGNSETLTCSEWLRQNAYGEKNITYDECRKPFGAADPKKKKTGRMIGIAAAVIVLMLLMLPKMGGGNSPAAAETVSEFIALEPTAGTTDESTMIIAGPTAEPIAELTAEQKSESVPVITSTTDAILSPTTADEPAPASVPYEANVKLCTYQDGLYRQSSSEVQISTWEEKPNYVVRLKVMNTSNSRITVSVSAVMDGNAEDKLEWEPSVIEAENAAFFALPGESCVQPGSHTVVFSVNGHDVPEYKWDIIEITPSPTPVPTPTPTAVPAPVPTPGCIVELAKYSYAGNSITYLEKAESPALLSELDDNEYYTPRLHVENKSDQPIDLTITCIADNTEYSWNTCTLNGGTSRNFAISEDESLLFEPGIHTIVFTVNGRELESFEWEIKRGKKKISIAAGDYVTFGHYEQDNNYSNGEEPIEWLVLKVDNYANKALLISRYGLDALRFNEELKGVTWSECTLRDWLNNDFYCSAFTFNERKVILQESATGLNDFIYLLSYDEAKSFFGNIGRSMAVAPTAYAIAEGAYETSKYRTDDGLSAGQWWTRDTETSGKKAYIVSRSGDKYGTKVNYVKTSNSKKDQRVTVRPSLWIDLNSFDQ